MPKKSGSLADLVSSGLSLQDMFGAMPPPPWAPPLLSYLNGQQRVLQQAVQGRLGVGNLGWDYKTAKFSHGVPVLLSTTKVKTPKGVLIFSADGQIVIGAAPQPSPIPGQLKLTLYFGNPSATNVKVGLAIVPEGEASGNVAPAPAFGGGSSLTPVAKSASYNANNGELVLMSSPAANAMLTLPTPIAGRVVAAKDVSGFAGGAFDGTGKLFSVNSASGLVDGVSQVLMLDDYGGGTFVADGANWWIVDGAIHFGADPRSVAGLFAWYDAGRAYTIAGIGVGGRNMFVTDLADLSGNGNALHNVTAGQEPDWDRGGPNRRARMLMNGGQFLPTQNVMTPPAGSVTALIIAGSSQLGVTTVYQCVVAQNANATANTGFLCHINTGNASTALNSFVSNSVGSAGTLGANGAGSTGLGTATEETILNQHLWTLTADGVTPYVKVDGFNTTYTADPRTFTPTSGTLYIGQSHFAGANGDQLKGSISEVLLYGPSVSAAAIIPIERYLMKKHGLRF